MQVSSPPAKPGCKVHEGGLSGYLFTDRPQIPRLHQAPSSSPTDVCGKERTPKRTESHFLRIQVTPGYLDAHTGLSRLIPRTADSTSQCGLAPLRTAC